MLHDNDQCEGELLAAMMTMTACFDSAAGYLLTWLIITSTIGRGFGELNTCDVFLPLILLNFTYFFIFYF